MSEVRLIDADALIQELCGDCIGIMKDGECRFGKMCGDMQFVRNAPTIDPVKHGRWIDRRSIAAMNRYECSVCKRMTTVDEFMGKPMYAYCPWCGARMEGDGDDQ